jgi:ABC-2 type transport system ATP-binding protein
VGFALSWLHPRKIRSLRKTRRGSPAALAPYRLEIKDGGTELTYTYDSQGERTGITALMRDLSAAGIRFKDLQTRQSSLEEIFVGLIRERT